MKFTKLMVAGVFALALLLLTESAQAQRSGLQSIVSSGTAASLTTNEFILAGVTNFYGGQTALTNIYPTNLVVTCGDYDYVGLTWKFTGITSTTNGAIVLRVFRSFDNGATYEFVPGYTLTVTPPVATTGAATYPTCTNLDMHGATHFAITRVNLSADYITNESLTANFKIPKVGSVSSSR